MFVPVEDVYSAHDLAVVQAESEKAKWTFMVYMAADSDISYCALYDIVSMQQANIDSEIEVYVLADRAPVDNPRNGDYVTPYGTYQWDSIWPDTRIGKITYVSVAPLFAEAIERVYEEVSISPLFE